MPLQLDGRLRRPAQDDARPVEPRGDPHPPWAAPGVREILARSEAANRRGGNLRGTVAGRRALGPLRAGAGPSGGGAGRLPGSPGELERQREPLARGACWACWPPAPWAGSGRPEEAAAELAPCLRRPWRSWSPKSGRPSARRRGTGESARREAAGTPSSRCGRPARPACRRRSATGRRSAALEPYRAARLVFDVDLLCPARRRASWRREAIDTFRRIGALGARRAAGGPGRRPVAGRRPDSRRAVAGRRGQRNSRTPRSEPPLRLPDRLDRSLRFSQASWWARARPCSPRSIEWPGWLRAVFPS